MNTISRALIVVALMGAVVGFGRVASPDAGVAEISAAPATTLATATK